MRKKVLLVWFCLFFTVGIINSAAATMIVVEGYGDEYPHYLNTLIDPESRDEVIMAPLQDLAREMGWTTAWDVNTSIISIQGNGNMIKLQIENRLALVNQVTVDMPAAPYAVGENIMIPVKFISESLGYHVMASSQWDNLDQIYVTPYNLISDSELAQVNGVNFIKIIDHNGFIYFKLQSGGKTPGGIGLDSSVWDVLQVYGVPRSPEPTLNYPGDWSGTLEYWGSFIPNSGMGTFYEFTFDHGRLVDLTICC